MSDEITKSILERITVSYSEPQLIPGGHKVTRFFDCMRLTPNDLARLAAQATGHLDLHQFGLVVGVAYTGILFAAAVAGGRHVGILRADGVLHGPPPDAREVLLVDDVVFSGTSISRAKTQLENQGYRVTAFACIVDRTSEMQTGANADQTNITLPLYSSYTV